MQICGGTRASAALLETSFEFPSDMPFGRSSKKEEHMTLSVAPNPIGRTSHGGWGFLWLKVDFQPNRVDILALSG